MSHQNRLRRCIVLAGLLIAAPAWANVVIGDWEGSTDGWIDWGTQAPITAPKYTYSASGATRGSSSLQLTQAGWNQNLAIKLQENGLIPAFLANTQISIDVSVPASQAPEGFAQIWELAVNSPAGWNALQPVPTHTFGFPNPEMQTVTLTWDYSAILANIPDNPGWVELILATNNDSTHTTFYFDNARLVPEPASLALLGLGGLTLLRRRRA